MARCKYCHESITRLDKEVCPFCGGLKPLEGTDDSTQDITKVIGQVENTESLKFRSKVIAAILAILFGVFGANLFYLGKIKKGLIVLAISVLFIVGFGSILFFAIPWHNALAFLIFYFILETLMIGVGIAYLTKHNITDKNGAFLK